MAKAFALFGLLLLLSIDGAMSMRNFSNTTLDGDMARIVAPSDDYRNVLENPLGIGVWESGKATAAPNRAAAHHGFSLWMNNVPRWMPSDGMEGLYQSVALLKTVTHFGLLCLLLYALMQVTPLSLTEKGLGLLCMAALFQDSSPMTLFFSVINPAITYVYFYSTQALLLGLLAILLFQSTRVSATFIAVMAVGVPVLALGGPLNAPAMGIGGVIYLAYRKLRGGMAALRPDYRDVAIGYVLIWTAYSFWLGLFNTEHGWANLALTDRYERMWEGILILLEPWHGAWFFLLPVLAFNLLFLRKSDWANGMAGLYLALAAFMVIWVLLLPMGGYRSYRPHIVRGDTLVPVNLVLIWMFAHTSVLLARRGIILVLPAVLCAGYFLSMDWETQVSNAAERAQFARLAHSAGECVALPRDGTLMHWEWNYESGCEESRWNLVYLNRIGVVQGRRLYHYQSMAPDGVLGRNKAVVGKLSGKCLDARAANISQWTCLRGDNQRFRMVESGDGYFNLINAQGGLCLDVADANKQAGQKTVLTPCNGGESQRFSLEGKGDGYYALRYKHSGLCLDVAGASAVNGAALLQWYCASGDNQRFRFAD